MNEVRMWIASIGYLTAITFLLLSLLHAFWALGGKWALRAVIPPAREYPSKFACWLVSFLLFLAMLIVLGKMGLWGRSFPPWIFTWGIWGVSIVFLLRAIGDFNNIGLFKKAISTIFAYLDKWLFTPLCLLLFIFCVIIATTF